MKCPVCKEPDLVMADRQNIEIDYCPQCRGVWLDRGELDKIIERAVPAASTEAPPVRQAAPDPSQSDHSFGHRYDKDDRYRDDRSRQAYPHKKRKGFLGDLFDFD
jgi:Zn-finger nucleic acid-binding protein